MRYLWLSILLLVGSITAGAPLSASAFVHPIQIAGYVSGSSLSPRLSIQSVSVNDELFDEQTNLTKIQVPQAWESTTGSNIVIAVIDTGIDKDHEDLKNRLWYNSKEIAGNKIDDDKNGFVDDVNGYNFVADNANVSDNHGHGTGVASIIAASTNNRAGIAGINWSAKIMPIKALDGNGSGDFEAVTSAIRYAVDNGARIINTSFGASQGDSELRAAVQYALSKNVLIVSASGNSGENEVFYPAAYSSVVSVGSITSRNRLSSFSNYGAGLDLVAPGEAVPIAAPDQKYSEGYGTSFATAEVSGVASLVWARYPGMGQSQVARAVIDSATELTFSSISSGLVNASAAVATQPVALTGVATVVGSPTPANGVSTSNISLTVSSSGTPQSGVKIKASVSGSGNIVNTTKIPTDGELFDIGTTDSSGQVSFALASIYPETKTIKFIPDNGASLESTATVNFSPVTNPAYQVAWVSQSPYPMVKVGQTTQLQVTLRNTGQTAWLGKEAKASFGQFKLGTDRPQDRSSSLYDSDSWLSGNRVATIPSSIVRPGETVTITFNIKGSTPGRYREYFRPVVEGITWLNDLGIYWDVTVLGSGDESLASVTDAGGYSAELVVAPQSLTLNHGQTASLPISFKNTGLTAWQPVTTGSGQGEVKLGTTNPNDRTSLFKNVSWLSNNRAAGSEFRVMPGSSLSLTLGFTAPQSTGSYVESFRLVSEYVTWFGPVVSIPINVK